MAMQRYDNMNLSSTISSLVDYWNVNKSEYKEIYNNFCEVGNIRKLELKNCEQVYSNIKSYLPGRKREEYKIKDVIHSLLLSNPARYDNALQPSIADNFLLKLIEPFNDLSREMKNPYTSNKRKWEVSLELLKDVFNVDGLRRTTGDMRREMKNITKDLSDRAKIVAKKVELSGVRVVRLIDGHGRIIYRCIEELSSNNFFDKGGYIQVYDIDSTVTQWHKETLPSYPELEVAITQNVFGGNGYPNIVTRESLSNSVLYLNFSGIGGESAQILCNIIDTLDDDILHNLIISLSYIRGVRTQIQIRHLIAILLSRGFKCLVRDDFITFATDSDGSLERASILSDCRRKEFFRDIPIIEREDEIVDITTIDEEHKRQFDYEDKLDQRITELNAEAKEIAEILRSETDEIQRKDLESSFYLLSSELQDLLLYKSYKAARRVRDIYDY